MSVQKAMQIGGDEPFPQALIELQQLALGTFLIWDVLEKDYSHQELVETAALADWARKYQVSRTDAVQMLVMVKEKYMSESWAHYIHCRDFKKEGWFNALLMTPEGNADVLKQIKGILEARPFPEGKG
jgi:hypothetical protein